MSNKKHPHINSVLFSFLSSDWTTRKYMKYNRQITYFLQLIWKAVECQTRIGLELPPNWSIECHFVLRYLWRNTSLSRVEKEIRASVMMDLFIGGRKTTGLALIALNRDRETFLHNLHSIKGRRVQCHDDHSFREMRELIHVVECCVCQIEWLTLSTEEKQITSHPSWRQHQSYR